MTKRSILSTRTPIIVAMDFDEATTCLSLAKQLNPEHCRLKVGKELFTAAGPTVVEQLISLGFDVFLDLKFHDIPNTVAKAISVCVDLGVWMVNVHASGGERMLLAAKESLDKSNASVKPLLIAVTVLTSMSGEDLFGIGIHDTPINHVLSLASLAKQAGFDGVVCSAQEAETLKHHFGRDFYLVTPGIRLTTTINDDQRRVVTPSEAIMRGSDYLVIGRPITQASAPAEVCEQIYRDVIAL